MYILLYILLALLFIIIVLAMIAPKSYVVNREITIDKPLKDVFKFLKFIENQDQWSPWAEKDPNMKKTYSGSDGTAGYISAWKGNKDVGEGEQEIKNVVENEMIETELRFLKPFKSTSDAYIKVNKNNGGTTVVWGFSGKNKFPVSIMMLFMNIEKHVGADFEQGLKKLKRIMEIK